MKVNIITNLLGNKKKSKRLLKYINKLESKSFINNIMALFILKSIIIIVSYYPKKRLFVYNFIKLLYKSKIKSRDDLLKNIKLINLQEYEDSILDDYYMDKLIFKTFTFIYNTYQINKDLPIILVNEILLNISRIKTSDTILKIQIYLLYLCKSNTLFIKNIKKGNEQIYIKIMEFCGNTTKLINNYITNK